MPPQAPSNGTDTACLVEARRLEPGAAVTVTVAAGPGTVTVTAGSAVAFRHPRLWARHGRILGNRGEERQPGRGKAMMLRRGRLRPLLMDALSSACTPGQSLATRAGAK